MTIKIVTVNINESYVKTIKMMIEDNETRIFPSRSELIRVAVRRKLLKIREEVMNKTKYGSRHEIYPDPIDDPNLVRVPNGINSEKPFTTYKILRKLEVKSDD